MTKHFLFPYLRIFFLLSTVPLVYLFWEWGAAEKFLSAVRPPPLSEPIRLGQPAPDFFVPSERMWSKKEFRLHTVKGHPVVIHFWATWCGPCLEELPDIIEIAQRYRVRGYTFLAVAIDQNWGDLEKFFQRHPQLKSLPDAMALALDPNAEIAGLFRSSRFPETVLINHEMVMDNKFIGAQPWRDPRMATFLDPLQRAPQPN